MLDRRGSTPRAGRDYTPRLAVRPRHLVGAPATVTVANENGQSALYCELPIKTNS